MTRHWRWLFAAALLVGAAVPFVLGGDQVLVRLRSVPLGWLALLVAMIAVCWNLNAWRLRVMLNGRAPGLGHGAALARGLPTRAPPPPAPASARQQPQDYSPGCYIVRLLPGLRPRAPVSLGPPGRTRI